ncbi:MAG: copper chaperone PCu(A)C [Gammaproteobacteria bacterium]|nr:copper chaperone PCu(A)C [Gammaproteobacteria bacterium]
MNISRALLAGGVLVLCATAAAQEPEIAATGAWIAAAPPVAGVNAGYLELTNKGAQSATLTGAESPRFARIEMHRSDMQNGVNTMRRESALEVPAGGTLPFAPGGLHLMLFSGAPPPRTGESIPLTLIFADGVRIPVTAEVRPFSPGAGSHQH